MELVAVVVLGNSSAVEDNTADHIAAVGHTAVLGQSQSHLDLDE